MQAKSCVESNLSTTTLVSPGVSVSIYTWFSLRASSPGRSGSRAGKGRRALEFEYLHRKSRCEMLIGRDDISNDVITLGTCFSMSVYIGARFRFALNGGNLTAQSTGSHRGIGGGFQIPAM